MDINCKEHRYLPRLLLKRRRDALLTSQNHSLVSSYTNSTGSKLRDGEKGREAIEFVRSKVWRTGHVDEEERERVRGEIRAEAAEEEMARRTRTNTLPL